MFKNKFTHSKRILILKKEKMRIKKNYTRWEIFFIRVCLIRLMKGNHLLN